MVTDAVTRMQSIAREAAERRLLRELYVEAKAVLLEAGWLPSDFTDPETGLDTVLAADMADGPGAERAFDFGLAERRRVWKEWFEEVIGPRVAAGINERMRAQIALEKEKTPNEKESRDPGAAVGRTVDELFEQGILTENARPRLFGRAIPYVR